MIYHLVEYLEGAGVDIPGMGLFNYLSFRAISAMTVALLVSLFAGKKIIRLIQKKQIGEEIRDLGLEGQMQKKGTPTMGGIIIFLSIIIPVLLFADLSNIYNILLIISTIWFFLIGFADDYIKVFKKNKEGMSARSKLVAQSVLGLAIGLAVCFSDQIVIREQVSIAETVTLSESGEDSVAGSGVAITEKHDVVKSTKTTIPFIKSHEFDYKWLSPFKGKIGWYCKWAIYVLMIIVVITACSNGVNLTDGMDGLATGTSAIVGVVLGIFAWLSGNIVNAEYLNIMYIPGSGEIAVFLSAFVGALNELDALANIDFATRTQKPAFCQLEMVRIGTCGGLQPHTPVGTYICSRKSIGFDGLLNYYAGRNAVCDLAFEAAFTRHMEWNPQKGAPYVIDNDAQLLARINRGDMVDGVTIAAGGFFGPQGRQLRIPLEDPAQNEKIMTFEYEGQCVTNFEMEGSALAGLSRLLGHRAMTVCMVIANRRAKEANTNYKNSIDDLIAKVLERI